MNWICFKTGTDSLPLSHLGSPENIVLQCLLKSNLRISGPAQFKPMLYKGQLYSYVTVEVTYKTHQWVEYNTSDSSLITSSGFNCYVSVTTLGNLQLINGLLRWLRWGRICLQWRSIPGLGIFPGEGNGYSFQYSGLENSMDR